jgi:hypothetical protein
MAAVPPMTWYWKASLTATGVTALAGWLASPSLEPAGSRPRAAATTTASSATTAAAVSDVEEQARRLSVRLVPAADAAPPSRNPFQFGARPAARRAVRPAAPVERPPVEAPAPAPFPLRLSGIALDTVDGVEKRIAIISGPGGLELAAAGDAAAPGYRVLAVGESYADVERASDGTRERLTLGR